MLCVAECRRSRGSPSGASRGALCARRVMITPGAEPGQTATLTWCLRSSDGRPPASSPMTESTGVQRRRSRHSRRRRQQTSNHGASAGRRHPPCRRRRSSAPPLPAPLFPSGLWKGAEVAAVSVIISANRSGGINQSVSGATSVITGGTRGGQPPTEGSGQPTSDVRKTFETNHTECAISYAT